MKKLLLSLAAVAGIALAGSANVTDVLTVESLNLDSSNKNSTGYAEFTVTGESGAVYSLQCAHNKGTYLQFRSSNNNSGVVVTKAAGTVLSVTLTWDSSTNTARKVNVYSSNDAYSAPSALYESDLKYDAQLQCDATTPTSYTFSTQPAFIGLRSASGALYLTKIEIEWANEQSQPSIAAPKISCEKNMVTITADGADAIYYTVDGTEPTTSSTKYTAPFAITANTTVKAIATKGSEVSRAASYNAVYEGNYVDFAAFVAANTTGTVDGPISVLYQSADRRYLWLQDKNKGYMLAYTASSTNSNPTLVNGDVLSDITGKYSPFNSLPEMVPSAFGTVTKGTAVQPNEYTVEELAMDMVNEYIVLKNVAVSGLDGKNFTITDETGTVPGYNTLGDLFTVPEGEGFTLVGFVCRYKDTLQVTPISITGGEIIETVATPVFNPGSSVIAKDTKIEITCATEGATIFYTIDGTVPSVSSTEYTEAITVSEAMTIKAIAVKEGWNNSAVAEAQYTMLDPNATIATFDFNDVKAFAPDFAVPTEASTGTDVAGMKFTYNNATLSFAENTASYVARIWKLSGGDTQLRVYTTDSFTVSVPDSFELESIAFTSANNTASSKYLDYQANTGSYALDTDNVKSSTWRPTADKTRSVTFSVLTNGRIDTMTVTMRTAADGVEDITVADENAPVEYYNLQGVRVANPTTGLYLVKKGNTVTKQIIR